MLAREVENMKKYYIYDMNTDEKIGEVMANTVVNAELKFLRESGEYGSDEIYALTAED